MTLLTVIQTYSATWITLFKSCDIKKNKTCLAICLAVTQIMCVSLKIVWNLIFSISNWLKMFFFSCSPKVLVITDNPSNVQDCLSFWKSIYTPFKWVSKVTELKVCQSQNRRFLCFFKITSFFIYSNFRPCQSQCKLKKNKKSY